MLESVRLESLENRRNIVGTRVVINFEGCLISGNMRSRTTNSGMFRIIGKKIYIYKNLFCPRMIPVCNQTRDAD